jgi:hypothetical protein
MTWRENQAFEEMYERAGFMITRDGGLTLLAGATLGGGELATQQRHMHMPRPRVSRASTCV